MKYVIWETEDEYNVTSSTNYYRYVQSLKQIRRFSKNKYKNANDVIQWMCMNTSAKATDFERKKY